MNNMNLSTNIKDQILNAEAKALATTGVDGLNVVPVSVVFVEDDHILFCDFFMSKTVENIKENTEISLCAWSGLQGVQVKGRAEYLTTGSLYEEMQKAMTEKFPERTLKGVLKIAPQVVYDVSAGSLGKKLSGD